MTGFALHTVFGQLYPGEWKVVAPAGTPKPFLQRLNQELRLILEQPLVIERLAQAGVELAPSSVEELDRYLQSELSRWLRVVKKANVTVD